MTLKQLLEKLPPELESKVSGVSYMEDGYDITLYWQDDDGYANVSEITYYNDGFYLFDFESFEVGHPSTASSIISKKNLQVIKDLIKALGGEV